MESVFYHCCGQWRDRKVTDPPIFGDVSWVLAAHACIGLVSGVDCVRATHEHACWFVDMYASHSTVLADLAMWDRNG